MEFKDEILVFRLSGFAYKSNCGDCYATCCSKIKAKMYNHSGVSSVTGGTVKGDNDSAIKHDQLFLQLIKYWLRFEEFLVLASINSNVNSSLK